MSDKMIGYAAWHPTKGFDEHAYEGSIVYADLEGDGGILDIVKDLNDIDGTNVVNGWRAVKVEITRVIS